MKKPIPSILLVLFLVSPLLVWIILDNSVWSWDASWYGEESANSYYLLTNNFGYWFENMFRMFGNRTPGIAWIGQAFIPLGYMLGKVETGLLMMNVIFSAGSLWLLHNSVLRLTGSRILAGSMAVTMASAPMFIGMGQAFFVESMQLFSVSYFFYLAICGRDWKPRSLMGGLLLATALAMGAKISSPIYAWFPGVVILFNLYRSIRTHSWSALWKDTSRWSWLGLAAGLAAGISLAGWYLVNWKSLVAFTISTSSGSIAQAYGSEKRFLDGLVYRLNASQWSFFLPMVGFGILAILLLTLLWWLLNTVRRRQVQEGASPKLDLWLFGGTCVQVVLIYLVFSLQTNEETRYMLPILPSLLILLAVLMSRVPSRIPAVLLLILMLGQWGRVYAYSFKIAGEPRKVSNWVQELERDRYRKYLLMSLDSLVTSHFTNTKIVFTVIDIPWLNHNSLSFYSAQLWPIRELRVTYALPFAYGDSADQAMETLKNSPNRTPFVLTMDASRMGDSHNIFKDLTAQVNERLANDPQFELVDFPNDLGILLYRNRQDHANSRN